MGPRYVNAVTDSPVLMDGWGVFSRGGTLFQRSDYIAIIRLRSFRNERYHIL